MKKFGIYVCLVIALIIFLPTAIIQVGGGIKKLAVNDFKKTYNVGQTTVEVYEAQNKRNVEMNIEDYVKGVIAAELPKDFDIQTMKAQAIAARTYALARKDGLYRTEDNVHANADVCTDIHCQAWTSKDDALKRWGTGGGQVWDKIDRAVSETAGLVLTYDGKLINPLYHSNSGGMTENVSDVWLTSNVPYLVSVASPGEEVYEKEYNGSLVISYSDFIKRLKAFNKNIVISEKDPLKDVKIGLRTASGRVVDIKAGNMTMKGTEFRVLMGLKSTNFTIEKTKENSIKIVTIGNGHGVGMSQCGANVLAAAGKDYSFILTYYYQGAKIVDYKNQ